ncbi:hypothetical protein QOT17_020117 [Balamuthia mandrillaris]
MSHHLDSKSFEFFFGRPLSYPDNCFNSISKLKTPREITFLTKVMLQIIYPSIYKKIAKYSINVEKHFNTMNRIIHFSPGDKVMLKNSSANSKTDPKFLGALKPVDPDTPVEDEHFEVEKILDVDGPHSDCYYLMK